MEKSFGNYVLEYQKIDGGISLSSISFPNETKELVLPDEIDGEKVIEIGEQFIFRKSGPIESLVLPKYLKRISKQGLRRMYHLKKVEIPASVEIIEEKALEGCESLVELTFESDSKLKSIGTSAFKKCFKLKEIYLPEGLEIIGKDAFYDCANKDYSLKAHLPSSLKECDVNSFSQYSKGFAGTRFSKITIVYSAYSHAKSSVVFDEKINDIELEKSDVIVVDKSEYYIDPNGALLKRLNIVGNVINIPSKISHKGSEYPVYCIMSDAINEEEIDFDEIVIPEGVVTISTHAFNIKSVKKPIFLPKSILDIENNAFIGDIPFIHVPFIDKEEFVFDCKSFVIYENEFGFNNKYAKSIIDGIRREDIHNNNDFYYVVKNKKVGLIKYIGRDEGFYIPDVIDSLPVTMICPLCFYQIDYVEKLVIPKNIEFFYYGSLPKEYGSISFSQDSHLRYLDRNSITSGYKTSLVLPKSIEFIDYTFSGLYGNGRTHTDNLIVPEFTRLRYLMYSSLADRSVKKLYLPKTIYYVGSSAIFYKNIEKVVFEDGSSPIYFHFNSNVYRNKNLKYNHYKGGLYLGSKSNPYILLVYIEDVGNPIIDVHPDTLLISDVAFEHTANAVKIHLGDEIKAIWSPLPRGARPIIQKWPASLQYINKSFVDKFDKEQSEELSSKVKIIERPIDVVDDLFVKRPRWDQDE